MPSIPKNIPKIFPVYSANLDQLAPKEKICMIPVTTPTTKVRVKILIQNQVDFNNTKNVVVVATMLVLGLGGATLALAYGDLSLAMSGMSLAAIVGIVLNLAIPEEKHE